jgi:hypothetical protein
MPFLRSAAYSALCAIGMSPLFLGNWKFPASQRLCVSNFCHKWPYVPIYGRCFHGLPILIFSAQDFLLLRQHLIQSSWSRPQSASSSNPRCWSFPSLHSAGQNRHINCLNPLPVFGRQGREANVHCQEFVAMALKERIMRDEL